MSRWISVRSASKLPPVSGCYAIYLRDELLYIGSAVNIRTRFCAHHISDNRICYRTFAGDPADVWIKYRPSIKYGDWLMVELRLLRRLRPPHNQRQLKVRWARG